MIGPETILVLVVLIIVGAFVVLVDGAVRSLRPRQRETPPSDPGQEP